MKQEIKRTVKTGAATYVLVIAAVILFSWPLLERLSTHNSPSEPAAFVCSQPVPLSPTLRDTNVSKQGPQFTQSFISPSGTDQVHVASITRLENGVTVAVWYGGTHEGSADTQIFLTLRPPGSTGSWTEPRGIVDRLSASQELNRYIKKIGNPLIFSRGNRLMLLYVTVSVGGWSGSSLNIKTSNDLGNTWSQSQRLTLSPFFNVSTLARNNPIAINDSNGNHWGFAVPVYHECLGIFSEMLWLQEEDNDTPSPASRSNFTYYKTRMTWGKRLLQPSVVPLSPHRAIAFYRSHKDNSDITIAVSNDTGKTWSKPQPISLPNPGAGLNALRLTDGRILLAYNDSKHTREKLALAIIDKIDDLTEYDSNKQPVNGHRYNVNPRKIAMLENTPGGEFSYPYLLGVGNGEIHLVYTWQRKRIKHVAFNEAWVDRQLESMAVEPTEVTE